MPRNPLQVRNLENKCKKNTKGLREEAEIKLKDMETVQKQRDKFKVEKDKLELQLKHTRNEEDQEENRLMEDNKMKENTIDNLRDEIESLKLNISASQLNVTSCQAELASERADRWGESVCKPSVPIILVQVDPAPTGRRGGNAASTLT